VREKSPRPGDPGSAPHGPRRFLAVSGQHSAQPNPTENICRSEKSTLSRLIFLFRSRNVRNRMANAIESSQAASEKVSGCKISTSGATNEVSLSFAHKSSFQLGNRCSRLHHFSIATKSLCLWRRCAASDAGGRRAQGHS